jgi:ATP-dependent DNA ligase
VRGKPLATRRALLEKRILPKLADPVRQSPELHASLADLIHSVKAQGLEGLVAKRRDSKYEPGLRSGAWQKMRVNQGQELVIAGYTPSDKNFDAPIVSADGDVRRSWGRYFTRFIRTRWSWTTHRLLTVFLRRPHLSRR